MRRRAPSAGRLLSLVRCRAAEGVLGSALARSSSSQRRPRGACSPAAAALAEPTATCSRREQRTRGGMPLAAAFAITTTSPAPTSISEPTDLRSDTGHSGPDAAVDLWAPARRRRGAARRLRRGGERGRVADAQARDPRAHRGRRRAHRHQHLRRRRVPARPEHDRRRRALRPARGPLGARALAAGRASTTRPRPSTTAGCTWSAATPTATARERACSATTRGATAGRGCARCRPPAPRSPRA